jgi:hypothetical protein
VEGVLSDFAEDEGRAFGSRTRAVSAAPSAHGAEPRATAILRLQRSAGNRASIRMLAREPDRPSPEDTRALTPQEMWDRVLAERGMGTRVPPHGVREADARVTAAKDGLAHAEHDLELAREDPDLRLGDAKADQPAKRAAQRARRRAEEQLVRAQAAVAKADKAAASAHVNRSEPAPSDPARVKVNKQQLGHGTFTYGAIQVTDSQDRRIAFGMGSFEDLHAEETALIQIRDQLALGGIRPGQKAPSGWTVTVVVDQAVCDERCRPALRRFADDYGVARDRVLAHYPERVGGAPVTPKTASKNAHVVPVRIAPGTGEAVLVGGEYPFRLSPPRAPASTPPPASTAPPESTPPRTRAKPNPPRPADPHPPTPKGNRPPKLSTAEVELAAKEASTLKQIGRNVATGLKLLFSRYVTVPLSLSLELLNAVSVVTQAMSKLAGDGWMLGAQIHQARELGKASEALVQVYGAAHYRSDLKRLMDTALSNDEKYARLGVVADYWSSLDLSDFCVNLRPVLAEHVDACQKILDRMTKVNSEVSDGAAFCRRELEDPAVWTAEAAGAATGVPVGLVDQLYMLQQDFEQISDIIGGPVLQLTNHLSSTKADLQMLEDNILTYGLAGVQAG